MSSLFSLEKVLSDAKNLVTRLKDHENAVDGLVGQAQDLGRKVDSMKMYQENLNALNELAKQRPHADLTVGLFQESSEISQLEHENTELQQSLDEHQEAIELIMSQYRRRVSQLVVANRQERAQHNTTISHSMQAHEKIQNIHKMAGVMWSAVAADNQPTADMEYVAQLQMENNTLRELLAAGRHCLQSPVCSQAVQTGDSSDTANELSTETANSVSVRDETELPLTAVDLSGHAVNPTSAAATILHSTSTDACEISS